MKRIKVSKNFFLDEVIHPNIYNRFKGMSTKYINKELIILLQLIRDNYGEPIYINTWATGGVLINSGLRDYKTPLGGKLNRSRHYYGLCLDLHTKDIKALQKHIYENRDKYFRLGLTVIEDFKYTPTWCHISVEWTKLDKVQIIKP